MAHLAHYRQAHPLPFVITHWVNLIAMLMLIFTGLYIHYPFVPGLMGMARGVHLCCGIVLLLNCLLRMVLAFFVKSSPAGGTREQEADYKSFFPQKDNRHQLGAWIKYYLFMKKDHPLSGKYGVPQKIAYAAIPVLILLVAFTGFCLWSPTSGVGLFGAFNELVGGVAVTRIIHYFIMWAFILFTFIHVYLANIEGFAPTRMMFFWQEHGGLVYDPETHNIVGNDDLGEEHE